MDIYWIGKDKKRMGPEPEVVIVTKLETGDLTPDTMGWHKGCSGWVRIDELPALSSYFRKQEDEEIPRDTEGPVTPADSASSFGGERPGIQVAILSTPGPMVRLWARLFDLFLYVTVVLCFLTWLSPKPEDIYPDPRFRLFMLLPWIIIEAAMLKWWGTTPGKFLCGISLHSLNSLEYRKIPAFSGGMDTGGVGKRKNGLSFVQTLRRSLQVMFFGVGFMMDILMLVAGFVSLYLLKKRGGTLWDRANATVESYRPMTGTDWFIFIMAFITLCYVNHLLIAPWIFKIPEYASLLQKLNN